MKKIARAFSRLLIIAGGLLILYAENLRIVAADNHHYDRWLGLKDVWPQYTATVLLSVAFIVASLLVLLMSAKKGLKK